MIQKYISTFESLLARNTIRQNEENDKVEKAAKK